MKKKDIKSKRNKILLLVLLICILLLSVPFVLVAFSKKSNVINAEHAFTQYLVNPVPAGITNIDADITEYQGSNIYISFTVDSNNTFQTIFNNSTYRKITCIDSDFSNSFVKDKLQKWNTSKDSFECFEGGSNNFINKFILFNKYSGYVIYNEILL